MHSTYARPYFKLSKWQRQHATCHTSTQRAKNFWPPPSSSWSLSFLLQCVNLEKSFFEWRGGRRAAENSSLRARLRGACMHVVCIFDTHSQQQLGVALLAATRRAAACTINAARSMCTAGGGLSRRQARRSLHRICVFYYTHTRSRCMRECMWAHLVLSIKRVTLGARDNASRFIVSRLSLDATPRLEIFTSRTTIYLCRAQ